jgi:glycine cleavage system H lipoate-binding protein
MSQFTQYVKSGLFLLAVVMVTIVAVVVLAVLSVAMRPLLMVGLALGAAVMAVIWAVNPRFRDWFAAAGEEQVEFNGLRLATDVALHSGHGWATLARKEVAVGADDFVQATLGPVETVELPAVGSRVAQGERLFSLRRGLRSVAVRAPLSGTVIGRNEELLARPQTVNEAPFTRGWAVRIQPDNMPAEAGRLRCGKEARDWFRAEIDRLMTTALANDPHMPTLPDGGTISGDLYRHIDDDAWQELKRAFFDCDEA